MSSATALNCFLLMMTKYSIREKDKLRLIFHTTTTSQPSLVLAAVVLTARKLPCECDQWKIQELNPLSSNAAKTRYLHRVREPTSSIKYCPCQWTYWTLSTLPYHSILTTDSIIPTSNFVIFHSAPVSQRSAQHSAYIWLPSTTSPNITSRLVLCLTLPAPGSIATKPLPAPSGITQVPCLYFHVQPLHRPCNLTSSPLPDCA